MTWFKVDDGFYTNPKIQRLKMGARGLWVTAGSYCGHQNTDGVIPAKMVRQLGGTPTQIAALIQHGLWSEIQDESGEKAYEFHDWLDFNPSREDVQIRREKDREKKREMRERKASNLPERPNVPSGQGGGRTSDVPQRVPGPVPLYPTRPAPTRPDPATNAASSGASGVQDDDGENASADFPYPPELASTVNRLLADGHSPADVEAAVREWDSRSGWKTPGLLPSLLGDVEGAANAGRVEEQRRADKRAKDAVRDACDLCDDGGWILNDNGAPLVPAMKCGHDQNANAEMIFEQRQRADEAATATAERRRVSRLAASAARNRDGAPVSPVPANGPTCPVAASMPPGPIRVAETA